MQDTGTARSVNGAERRAWIDGWREQREYIIKPTKTKDPDPGDQHDLLFSSFFKVPCFFDFLQFIITICRTVRFEPNNTSETNKSYRV